ncbi:hypothetical protein JOD43_000287 [Pullulanibacillus pueri]|nr:hypothetical protein [Pullulanibacillus pueri]
MISPHFFIAAFMSWTLIPRGILLDLSDGG